jgi:hypothetical protein
MSQRLKTLLHKNPRAWVEVLIWSLVTVFVVVARVIYYSKSHSLTSPWMSNAYALPLVYAFILLLLALWGKDLSPYGRVFANTGISSLILYLFLMGVYDMASNYNESTPMFLYIGIVFLAIGVLIALFVNLKGAKKENETAVKGTKEN